MSDLQLELTPVDEPPAPKRRGGGGGGRGRVSPYTSLLDQIKAQPDTWFKLTREPLDEEGKSVKSASAARRIHEGLIRDVSPGEFESVGREGHVYARYVGQAGIDEWDAGEPERAAERERRATAKAAKAAAKLSENGAGGGATSESGELATAGAGGTQPASSEGGW